MKVKKSELKYMLEVERKAKQICNKLHHYIDLKETLAAITEYMKDFSGCESVSIKLYEKAEKPDCPCDELAEVLLRNENSFWSNNTSELFTREEIERDEEKINNKCSCRTYKSVAFINILLNKKIIGVIQLCDQRKGMFRKEDIEFYQMVGEMIGLAVQNSITYNKLKEAYEEIKKLRGLLPICMYCKKIRDDKGYWEEVEVYIRKHSEADFTHGICPECLERQCFELLQRRAQ